MTTVRVPYRPAVAADPVIEASRERREELRRDGELPKGPSKKNRKGRPIRDVPALNFGEFMSPMGMASEVWAKLEAWMSSLTTPSSAGGGDPAATVNGAEPPRKPRPIAADSPAGLARQRGALLFILLPLFLGLFFVLPALQREEEFVEAELAVEEREDHKFVDDEKKIVMQQHMVEESVTVADNPDLDGDGRPDGVEMHPNETAVVGIQQEIAKFLGQPRLDINLTSPPVPLMPPPPPEPPAAPMMIPVDKCTAALRVAQVEYFKAYYCHYAAGLTFPDPANPKDQSTLEEQAGRMYVEFHASRSPRGVPDIPAVAASEEAADLLPRAMYAPQQPPAPAPVKAQYQDPPKAASPLSGLLGGGRRLLKKGGPKGQEGKQKRPGYSMVVGVGESTLSFALATASAMEQANIPGVARLFEGSPEAYIRLEHVKRKIAQFDSGRLRLVGAFVGKDKGEVDMAPPPSISEQEWLHTAFFGDGHHVEAVPDNLRLKQVTPGAALSGGTPLMMSIDPELTAGVLEGMDPLLKAGTPRVLLLTADRLEFAEAFSQRYPYKVYALAAPNASGIPRILRVDGEVWDPIMQEIRGLERVTLMAVAANDPFNSHVEAAGITSCRCTHVLECDGMTPGTIVVPETVVPPALDAKTGMGAAATELNVRRRLLGKKNRQATTPTKQGPVLIGNPNGLQIAGMQFSSKPPCPLSRSNIKYTEYFQKGKKGL